MRELRTAVLTLVEASWEDQSGNLQTVAARMEDKSVSGACIRIKTPITVGSKLRIEWRLEQFSGIAKYCRSEGREYLVGIQREMHRAEVPVRRPVPIPVVRQEDVGSRGPLPSTIKIQSPPRQESGPSEIPVVTQQMESTAIERPAISIASPPSEASREIGPEDSPRFAKSRLFEAPQRNESQAKPTGKRDEAGMERKPMQRKWLGMAPWHNKQGGPNGNGGGIGNGEGGRGNHPPGLSPQTNNPPSDSTDEEAESFQIELLPVEDIYRAAGVMNPPRGYGIHKVVAMLSSEHIRGLSKEMKRAGVLMALDAAGTTIEQVQQDAKARLDALDSYEADRKKQFDGEWARRAEDIVQIQAELERVKAQYMARISRNLDAVARQKATFTSWQAMRRQEIQNISDAAELCLKSIESEPASALPDLSKAVASARPM
jgi:hypothetical protein